MQHGFREHAAPFIPYLDAYLDPETREELVVWGAGEGIVGRRRQRATGGKAGEGVWHTINGSDTGHVRGYDDVTAISIVRDAAGHTGQMGVLTGRYNGDLSLLSAEDGRFGERISTFRAPNEPEEHSGRAASQSLSYGAINSLDILPQRGMAAATTRTSVFLYDLPRHDASEVHPSAVFDLKGYVPAHSTMSLCNAKWMDEGNLLALGLKGCSDPLRFLSVNPDRLTLSTAAKNPSMEDMSISHDKLCPSSIQPVNMSSVASNKSFLLSAWRDGKCRFVQNVSMSCLTGQAQSVTDRDPRLQDLRTPSPFDVVYCDNIDPWSPLEALLPFGTERFVGGGMNGATIKIFDYRWTKPYYHTAGLPCSNLHPFPRPNQPFAQAPPDPDPDRILSCCDHLAGFRCRWHALSRDIYYRPNCSIFFSKALPPSDKFAGVWALARASDVSPNFYIGISGGIVEAALQPNGSRAVDPHFGLRDDSRSVHHHSSYTALDLDVSMMETGDGLASPQNARNIRMPPMHGPHRQPLWLWWPAVTEDLQKRHRLDSRFQSEEDFKDLA